MDLADQNIRSLWIEIADLSHGKAVLEPFSYLASCNLPLLIFLPRTTGAVRMQKGCHAIVSQAKLCFLLLLCFNEGIFSLETSLLGNGKCNNPRYFLLLLQ